MNETWLLYWLSCGTIISCAPEEVLVGWGMRHWSDQPATQSGAPSFYFPDFFLQTEKPWFTHGQYTKLKTEELIDLLKKIPQYDTSPLAWEPFDHKAFKATFSQLQEAFHADLLDKAVPYIIETAETSFSQERLLNSLISALTHHSNNYIYGFWDEQQGILGLSPELLFRTTFTHPSIVETMACAGTIDCRHKKEELLSDAKENREHQLVIQGIVEALTPYGDVLTEKISLLTTPHLTHLVTPIKVDCFSPPSFDTLVKALHPTPALGAIPKKEGLHWLLNYEKLIPRQRFGAPVGYLEFNEEGLYSSQCYVAIRNVQWNRHQLTLTAGCGMIRESDETKEWTELHLKLTAIKKTLSL